MLTARQDEIVWTGDRFLDHMFAVGGLTSRDLQLAFEAVRGAMTATSAEGLPDRHAQLRAAELLGQWLGWKGARDRDGAGADRITQVAVTLVTASGADARAPLPRGRLAIHLAGNGHAEPAPPGGPDSPAD